MKVSDFTARLAQHLNVTSVGEMGEGDSLRLADAVNAGLHDFYAKAPADLRRVPLLGSLLARKAVSLQLTPGATVFSGWEVEPSYEYCSVLIGGVRNVILPGGSLLFPWSGSDGEFGAEAFGDVAWFGGDMAFESLCSLPVVDGVRKLELAEEFPVGAVIRPPTHYRLEVFGQTEAARPRRVLRVWPLPDVPYRVQVEAQMEAVMVGVGDLAAGGRVLPVEDRFVVRFLLPFCLWHLKAHRLWKLPENNKVIDDHYGVAMADIEGLPLGKVVPFNQVGTPYGF
ncbi:hypothetical protein Ga0100231_004910 [Opitutaceae bacterium TAV4]|nr:hypothetical protein Ga0100231_004910 [Opitutaceae bacterium TAV4]RRK02336.1 hypothetical protein Ga0100230_004055 [Opitutaceae bacterium TAV3]